VSAEAKGAPAGLRAAEANTRWLAEHPEVLRAHRGQWLCVVDAQLVVADADWRAFAEQVKRYANRDGRYIVRVPTSDELAAAHPRL
jgi:hypothetical protein